MLDKRDRRKNERPDKRTNEIINRKIVKKKSFADYRCI